MSNSPSLTIPSRSWIIPTSLVLLGMGAVIYGLQSDLAQPAAGRLLHHFACSLRLVLSGNATAHGRALVR